MRASSLPCVAILLADGAGMVALDLGTQVCIALAAILLILGGER